MLTGAVMLIFSLQSVRDLLLPKIQSAISLKPALDASSSDHDTSVSATILGP